MLTAADGSKYLFTGASLNKTMYLHSFTLVQQIRIKMDDGQLMLEHRRRLAQPRGASLVTQRWVGAQSPDGLFISDMSCTFSVPADADIGTMPQKGTNQAHYIYCDMHHNTWPGGFFHQYVPQLQRGFVTSHSNSSTFVLQDTWLDSWYIQAQYIFSVVDKTHPVRGTVGQLVRVLPGDTIGTRIHYDNASGVWVLEIGVAPDPSKPTQLAPGSTSSLRITTPFMGMNSQFDSPFLGNTSCADYHQFSLGDLHEAWNMNRPDYYPIKQAWAVAYISDDFANMSGVHACCKHVGSACDKCPPSTIDEMHEAVTVNEPGHAAFTVTRSSAQI